MSLTRWQVGQDVLVIMGRKGTRSGTVERVGPKFVTVEGERYHRATGRHEHFPNRRIEAALARPEFPDTEKGAT